MIRYEKADDIKEKIKLLVSVLEMKHIDLERVFCIRSYCSSSRGIVARCHALPKIMQLCLRVKPSYIIEVVSENFDKQNDDEKIKTLIHELMHIPKAFGGGFRHHNVITKAKIEKLYTKFKNSIRNEMQNTNGRENFLA